MHDRVATPVQSHLEIREPSLLRGSAVVAIHAYGLVLIIPVGIAMLLVTLKPTGVWPVLLPLLALGFSALFLPLGLGNRHIRTLLRRKFPELNEREEFIVQVTFTPRLQRGLRSVVEDADDIGLLRLGPGGLVFEGDSVTLRMPWTELEQVESQNIGLRGLFVYGSPLVLAPRNHKQFELLEFAERSSYLLPTSRKVTRQIRQALVRYFLDQRAPGARSAAELDLGHEER